MAVAGAGLTASALAVSNRPLTSLTAASGANRHGPCSAGVGVVPDTGCPGGGRPNVAGCNVFPSDNAWNTDVSNYPKNANSDGYIAKIVASAASPGESHIFLSAGPGSSEGMPYIVVPANQPVVPITYAAFGSESDPGPFPIPLNAPIEQPSDQHVIVLQQGTCKVFELYNARVSGNGWVADSGAVWDLNSNARRPDHVTSADAAGMSIFAGIVKYEEVAAGAINHAIRVSVRQTDAGFIPPASHFAPVGSGANRPPMGLRLRLRADFDRSRFTGQARIVADALAKYGAIVADNGFDWIFFGAPNPGWDTDNLSQLWQVPGTAFEAVDTGPVLH